MTILEAVGDYLQSNGHGTLGTSLFLALLPEAPDACVVVYEAPGTSPTVTMGSGGYVVDRPSVQVICRGAVGDYPGARDKAQSIRLLLSAVTDQVISGVDILRIQSAGSVLPMGEDANGRPMVSVNFDTMVRV